MRAPQLDRIGALTAIVFAFSSPMFTAPTLASPLQEAPVAQVLVAAAPIGAVTLYQGRAMIERTADAPEEKGLFELRFEGLPSAIEPDSLQATVVAPNGDCKLLDVRYEERVTALDASNNPELLQAITELNAAQRASELIELRAALISDQNVLLNSIASKTATESAKDFGSKALDPAALAQQVAFLEQARNQLIDQRTALDAQRRENSARATALQAKVHALGGRTKTERCAVVAIGRSSNGAATVTLKYLVHDAGWAPRYAIRADMEATALVVEYNAEIRQSTGEDWKDVGLTLSTAQPTSNAQPRQVDSIFVDIYVPVAETSGFAYPVSADASMPAPSVRMRNSPVESAKLADQKDAALEAFFSDAQAVSTGTVVNFKLPRAVTIPSDAQKSRSQRIANIDTKPSFIHVARPLVETAVYLKAVTANASSYQFLAGPATVFLGGDSVGKTSLPDLAPGAEMTFWLGTDPRITAKRVLVKKDSAERGVFGKSDVMTWDYRIDLTSTNSMPVTVEVFDRMPVSRNEQIVIKLLNMTPALATDVRYEKDEKPQGFMKWIMNIPTRKEGGKAEETVIAWTVELTKPKAAVMSGNPE